MTGRMKLLVGIAAVLAIGLVFDQMNQDRPVSATQPSGSGRTASQLDAEPETPNEALLPALQSYAEVWTRPLFTQSRKPSRNIRTPRANGPSGATQAKPSDRPPEFTITGIAIRPEGGSVLVQTKAGQLVRVFLHEQIDGWTLDALEADMATLSRDGQSWQLPVGSE
ncbi:MAG: hypothetical protein COA47_09285 [Robiginitomaculum sp.]|nr:MAG: hypothetical protein COA47_09285 [Robiginitomaculum sp.]